MEFSGDGRWLATAAFDGRVRIMDLDNGSVAIPPLPSIEPAMLVAFSPDSRFVACATHSGIIHLWTTVDSHYLGSIFDHQASPRSLEFSSDGRRMLTCGGTATVHAWKLTPVTDPGLALPHSDRVTGADFCRSENKLATITEHGWLRIWNAEDGTAISESVFVPDPQAIPGSQTDLNTCRFHPHEPVLAIGNGWGQITLWDVSGSTPVLIRTIPSTGRYNIRQLSFHPDGERMMYCSNDRFVAVLGLPDAAGPIQVIQHPDQVWTVDVAPNGQYFATGCQDGRVRVFSTSAPHSLLHEADFGATINAVCFSPDGRLLLIAPADRTARFLVCDSWRPHERLVYGESFFESAAFSPDGQRAATASNAGQIQVWDVESGLPCGPPIYHRMYASAVRFNPQGTQLVSTSFDQFARIHDVRDRLLGLTHSDIESAMSDVASRRGE
jgi:WD40 repeat protein